MSMNNFSPVTEKSRKDFWTCWVEHEGLAPDGGCGVTVFRLSLTIDHIHWSPSFMKIVGWLWINTWFALLHYTLPLCPVERHHTEPKFPFFLQSSLSPLSPSFSFQRKPPSFPPICTDSVLSYWQQWKQKNESLSNLLLKLHYHLKPVVSISIPIKAAIVQLKHFFSLQSKSPCSWIFL